MSRPPESWSLQVLFDVALQDYEKQTGTKLADHPLAEQLETCHSVDSITAILQGQGSAFREFRGDSGKIMKSLKGVVHVLYTLSTSTALGESIGLPFPPARAIFIGFAILLAAVKDVSASYDALVDLFESMENFLNRLDIYMKVPPTAVMLDVVVKILAELLSTLALATKQVSQGRLKKFVKQFLGENDIETVLQRLDRLTTDEARTTAAQTLDVVHGLVQQMRVVLNDGKASGDSIQDALKTMQQIVSKTNQAERDKLQRDIRNWLSPPDPWKNHKIAHESQHSGTATWWIQGDAFADWKSSGPSSLLWIHGKPGAGKSVLCSAIVQDIRRMHASGLASLAFFYCDFRDDQKKDRCGLLSSLLVQLCHQSDAYSAILSAFYLAHGHGSQYASDSELVQCLKDMLELPGQATVYIIIDALDECPKTTGMPSSRDKVLKLVEELVDFQLSNLRICVTSRPEADIVPILDPLAFRSFSLHDESGQIQDIVDYIISVVNTDSMMRRWKLADKELVIDVLKNKADGMFRWAFCQLAYLRHCLPGRIRRALEELPETLDGTYERALQDIGDQSWEYAHHLFQCVAAASRPLRVKELAEFLAFDFNEGSTPKFLVDWRPEDPGQAILSTCASLLVVVNADGSPVIQFAHFSVKEYLTSARPAKAKPRISRFHVSMKQAHTIVAQGCLGVLLHLGERPTEDSLKKFPLAEYAAEHWVSHAQFEDVVSNIQDGMKRLLEPSKRHLAAWVWICDPVSPFRRNTRLECPSRAKATPLHYAAFGGMCDLIKFLIIERTQNPNARDYHRGETPLGVASRGGHFEAARILLKYGADTKSRDKDDWSPLDRASAEGHVEVARVLLEHGADVDAREKSGNTALHQAAGFGAPAVAQVLIEHHADVNAQDRYERTPLHAASEHGYVEVVKVLLEHGADVDAKNGSYRTPLVWASERGHLDVVHTLLDHGADVTAKGDNGETPLHLASRGGYLDVVRLLLQRGSNVHTRNNRGGTPLQKASAEGHQDVIQLLSEHGAEGVAPPD